MRHDRMVLSILIAMAGIVMAAPALRAQAFGDVVLVNGGTAGSTQGSPMVRSGPDGRLYVIWVDGSDGAGAIVLASSVDGGVTFSPSRVILPGHTAQAGMQRGPQLAVDRRGGIHVAWQERIVAGHLSAMYARSLDGGATFAPPILVAGDSGRYDQDFPSIAVDSSDNVSLAWIDNREIALGTSTHTQLYFARSTDRGATFGAPVRASRMPGGDGGSCECCNTAIATTADGTIFIAFRGNIDNNRDVHVARTSDGGASFEVFRAASQSWRIAACPMTGSSIAVDRAGTAHVVWRDSRQSSGGRDIVYYATLDRDGDACSADLVISDSPKRANFPSIGVSADGAIVVAWQDTRSDASDIHVSYSLDGGNTFSASVPAGGAPILSRQELVSIAIGSDGRRYAAWQDMRRDAGDITLARDTSALVTIPPGAVTASFPLDGAALAEVPALMWSAPSGLGEAYQVVYSVAISDGGTPDTLAPGPARARTVALAPGSYRWWVTARSRVGATTSGPFSFTLQNASGVRDDATTFVARIVAEPDGNGAVLGLTLDRAATVTITVHDVLGRRAAVPITRALDAGEHAVSIARGLPPGHYLCRVDAGAVHRTLPILVR